MAISPFLRIVTDRARRFRALPALLVGIAFLTACHPKPPAVTDPNDPNFIVAEQGDWTITRAELDKEVDNFLKQRNATREMVGAQMPSVETAMLKNMVLKKLLLEKAATMQLKDVDKDVAAQIDAIKEQINGPTTTDAQFAGELQKAGMTPDDLKQRVHDAVVIHKVLEAQAFKDVDPSEQEIDDFYAKYKDHFNIPAKLRASRVLILVGEKDTDAEKAAKKKTIDAARARVMKGEDFGKVATEVSQDRSSAPKGGDIGYFSRGESEPGFDDVAFKLKVNTVSPVFPDALGYQFVKITDSRPAGIVSLADARGIITPNLKQQKMKEQSEAYAKSLLDSSGVIYHLKLIDPPAQVNAQAAPGGPGGPGDTQAPPPDNGAASADGQAPPPAPAPASPQ